MRESHGAVLPSSTHHLCRACLSLEETKPNTVESLTLWLRRTKAARRRGFLSETTFS